MTIRSKKYNKKRLLKSKKASKQNKRKQTRKVRTMKGAGFGNLFRKKQKKSVESFLEKSFFHFRESL